MGIPLLSSAFCGCSLELGTKVIAWFQLVVQVIVFLIITVAVAFGLFVAGEEMAKEKNSFNTGGDDDEFFNNKNDRDRQVSLMIGVGVIVLVIVTVLLLIHFIATIFLVLGAHKKRPGYMQFWLVLAVIASICSIGSMKLGGIVSFLINLYCIWVVYSYYRQLKDAPEATSPPHREFKMQDTPNVMTPNAPFAPPPYSYGQKE